MTRIAVLTDIHGNLPALEAVIADMVAYEPQHVVVGGDMINGAPFSPEVLERIYSLRWGLIRGNHEFYLLDYRTPREPAARKGHLTFGYLHKQLIGYWYDKIAALPDMLTLYYPDAPPIRIAHGIPGDHFRAILPEHPAEEVRARLDGVWETTYVGGHYHLALERWVDHWHIINPGSVGMPADGIREAGYVILDGDASGWRATFRRVPYDIGLIIEAYEKLNLIEQLGAIGLLTYRSLIVARPLVNAFLDWKTIHCPDEPESLALAEAFLKSGRVWDAIPQSYKVNGDLFREADMWG